MHTVMERLSSSPIYRELLLDLCYRLRLADDLFTQNSSTLITALSLEDWTAKWQSVHELCDYAQALQLIYVDFRHLIEDSCHLTFPAQAAFWQWNELDGAEQLAQTLDRLHAISEGMRIKLEGELHAREDSL